jgi:DNA-binding NarL/FixJ family response regulator
MKTITVVLVDDHTVVRQGLRALLAAERGMEVVGEAENGRQAVAVTRDCQPDVVVMDVAMPLLNGFEATKQILKAAPSARVLALSSYSSEEHIVQMLNAGASGYVIKQTAANELLEAIREVHKGKTFLSPSVSEGVRVAMSDPQAIANREPTSREMEVLQLIAEGFSNKQIAGELGISIKTVEKHRQQVMNKLNIHDVAGLTRYTIARGLVEAAAPPVT